MFISISIFLVSSDSYLYQNQHLAYRLKYQNDSFDDSKLFKNINLVINPYFAYLVDELKANFTSFEFDKFLWIS